MKDSSFAAGKGLSLDYISIIVHKCLSRGEKNQAKILVKQGLTLGDFHPLCPSYFPVYFHILVSSSLTIQSFQKSCESLLLSHVIDVKIPVRRNKNPGIVSCTVMSYTSMSVNLLPGLFPKGLGLS